MILTTDDRVAGFVTAQTLGVVSGSTVRARFVLHDIVAGLKGVVGGELTSYTRMLDDAREEATVRMIEQAEKKGADAVVTVRYSTSAVMRRAAEVVAYGTAVKLARTLGGADAGADAGTIPPAL